MQMKNTKRIIAAMLAVIMVLLLAACGSAGNNNTQSANNSTQNETNATQNQESQTAPTNSSESQPTPDTETREKEQNSEKMLVLYFSADNTKNADAVSSATPMTGGVSSVEWIADIIHDTVGGDLVPIIPSVDYPLVYNDLADYAKKERDDGGRPAFEDLGVDPTSYDTVFIGYPIWWYEMPMIMDTFFETYDFSGVTIVPFNTHAGSRDGGTYSDIKELEPNANVLDGLAVRGEDVGKNSAKTSVEKWLTGLNLD